MAVILLVNITAMNFAALTEETILKTRQHFTDIHQKCIAEAVSGEIRVNDLDEYIKWQEGMIENMKSGAGDHTFTFLQTAWWIQTGECVPLISK